MSEYPEPDLDASSSDYQSPTPPLDCGLLPVVRHAADVETGGPEGRPAFRAPRRAPRLSGGHAGSPQAAIETWRIVKHAARIAKIVARRSFVSSRFAIVSRIGRPRALRQGGNRRATTGGGDASPDDGSDPRRAYLYPENSSCGWGRG